MNNCASWITCHDLWLKVKSCDLALSLVRLESIVFQLVAEPVVTTRVTSRGMATRGASDTQWSSSSGWQWHWRGWSRWPNDRETWWEDSGPSQWGQVDQAAGLSGHVEAVGGPGVASSLDTLDGMENLATDGQGSANAAGAPTTGADSQNPQRSALARWEADPWWNGQDPWQGEQSAHETSRRTSWPETDGWRGDASMHEAPWRSTWGSADTWRRDDQAIDRRSWNSWESGYKGDYSDPPTWPGWNHRKQWVISVRRWDRLTDHPVSRRADKILRALGWDMAADFEHLSESDLAGHGYLDLILKVIETKAGVRDGEERRMAFKRAMYQTGRRRDETLAQFAVRRLQDFSIATSHGINMPKDFQASLLKEGAGLSDQNVQNLTSLLHGQDSDPNEVARCLGLLDVSRSDRVTGLVLPDEDYLQTETFVTEEPDTMESGDDIASDDEKHILLELEKLELGEEQAMEVYMALDSTHRRRTWKQSKQFKQEARKDRGHFSKNVNGSTPQQGALGGPPGVRSNGPKPFRRRLNREQLKKVTKCRLCSKKGHWAEDCQLNKNKPGNVQAFAFLSGECAEQPGLCRGAHHLASFLSVAEVNSVLAQVLGDRWRQPDAVVDPVVYLTITSGQAIIDPGAAQDLIGKPAYEKLKEHLASHGLQPVVQQDSGGLRNPSGIGGSAKALFKALVPVSFGQKPGLLEMTVIDADIPPLVSVGFLDFLGTSLNLPKNKIVFEKLGITMSISKLPSGHRTIELCDWPGGAFPVPSNVKVNFGLEDGAFNLFADAVVPPPCVVKKELSVTWDVDVEHGIIQEESNQYHHHIHHCSRPSAVESSLVSARSDLATCFRSLQRQDMSDHQFLCDEEVKNSQTSMSRKSHVGNLGDCADCTSSCSLSLSGEKPPNSINLIRPLDMEALSSAATWGRWRQFMTRVFTLIEASHFAFVKLLVSEKTKKSLKSDRNSKVQWTEEQAACLHPPNKVVKRGNKYASWTVCLRCDARLSYTSRNIKETKMVPSSSAGRTQSAAHMMPESKASKVKEMVREMEESASSSTPALAAQPKGAPARRGSFRQRDSMGGLMNFLERTLTGLSSQNDQHLQAMTQLATAMNQLNQGQSMMLGYLSSQSNAAPAEEVPVMGPILHRIATDMSEAEMGQITSGDQWEDIHANPNLDGWQHGQ